MSYILPEVTEDTEKRQHGVTGDTGTDGENKLVPPGDTRCPPAGTAGAATEPIAGSPCPRASVLIFFRGLRPLREPAPASILVQRRQQIRLRRPRGRQQADQKRDRSKDDGGGAEGERIGGLYFEQLAGERPADED
jgi:hypothetical protein